MDSTTSVYDHATFMFPGSDNVTKMALHEILLGLEQIARPVVKLQVYLAIIGICVTTFHLIILTRKSMMTSSIISIMIGVALTDLVAMVATIQTSEWMFDSEGTDCSPPASHFATKLFWVFVTIRDMVRRSSTWLGVLMAFIRFFVIKFGARPRFQNVAEVKFGFQAVAGSYLASTLISTVYFFRYDMVIEGMWRPQKYCTGIRLDTVLPVPVQKVSALFTMYNGVLIKVYMLVNGTISKIIPCLLLPILTFLLILELRKAETLRKTSNCNKRNNTDKTTGLVILMAVSFFIVELPIGISTVFQVAYTDWGYLYLATYVNHFCNAIFVVNASGHCVICFLMSSQYRSVVLKFFHIVLTPVPKQKASTVSVQMT